MRPRSRRLGSGAAHRLPGANRALGLLSLALVIGLGLSLFLTSSLFAVEDIVVIGSSHLGSAEVARLCEVSPGTNILKVRTGDIRQRLLAHPRVAGATVSRQLPSSLVVTLEEREGVALLPCQGRYAELDTSGLPLEFHSFISALGLPVLTGVRTDGVTLGTPLSDAGLTGCLVCAKSLGPAGRSAVAEINLGETGELTVFTRRGVPVYFGPATGLEAKARAFLELLADLEADDLQVTYADVRYPRFPVLGSAGGPPEPPDWADPDVFPVFSEP